MLSEIETITVNYEKLVKILEHHDKLVSEYGCYGCPHENCGLLNCVVSLIDWIKEDGK